MSIATQRGFQDFAAWIDQKISKDMDSFRGSSQTQKTLDSLSDVFEDCKHLDWDGHGALPVEQDTMAAAYALIESCPRGVPQPEIGAEPDGCITLEWRKSPVRVLSLSVDPDGILHYAGLFGSRRSHGTMPMNQEFPRDLLRLVGDL